MTEISQAWQIVFAKSSAGRSYHGEFKVERQKQVLLGEWEVQYADNRKERHAGIGLMLGCEMVFSRIQPKDVQAGNEICGNIVYYAPIDQTGSLSALWSEPSIDCEVGSGIAVGGQPGDLCGKYQVTYFYPGGVDPVTFDLSIAGMQTESKLFTLEWHRGRQRILTGTGMKIQNGLAVAYNKPGIESQLVTYEIHSKDDQLMANGRTSSTESESAGVEIILTNYHR